MIYVDNKKIDHNILITSQNKIKIFSHKKGKIIKRKLSCFIKLKNMDLQ